jgi:hypothetical protein
MALNDDELKYKDVINTLKSLQEVKAPQNFQADLMRRINSERFEDKQSFWKKVFAPSRLIPSAALAVTAVILLFVVNITGDDIENPLLMEPKVRQDVIQAQDMSDIPLAGNEDSNQKSKPSDEKSIAENRSENSDPGIPKIEGDYTYSSAGFSIDKSGLNFRQINLTDEEKQRLNELKNHFRSLLKNSRNN